MMVQGKIVKGLLIGWLTIVASTACAQLGTTMYEPTLADRLIPIDKAARDLIPIQYRSLNQEVLPHPLSPLHSPMVYLPTTAPHAFFCRIELQVEKKSNVPFIFRLGDVERVQRLEGKTKPWIP